MKNPYTITREKQPLTLDIAGWMHGPLRGFSNRLKPNLKEPEKMRHGEDEKVSQLIEKAINLYKEHFLGDETEEFWTISYRERLRNKYLLLIIKLGDSLKNSEQWEKAVECYQRALEVDQIAEEFYQNLMICYRHLGQNTKAIEVYKHCKKILSAVLGIKPSPRTEAIYKTLVGNSR